MTKTEPVRTKKDIVRKISELADLPQVKTKEIVQWTLDAIIDVLVNEGRIELRKFGVFEVKTRRPRKARNPKTEEAVNVPAKNVVTFQPGKEMDLRVGELPKVFLPKTKANRVLPADTLPLPNGDKAKKNRKPKPVKSMATPTDEPMPTEMPTPEPTPSVPEPVPG